MDKNAIKKYAVWARRELISRVSGRAAWYGITVDSCVDADADSIDGRVLSSTEKKQRAAFISKVQHEGYEQAIEEVAYTWFNRFCALRYMEVNGYLPSHIRVFTDDANEFKPQILDEAIHLEIEGLDKEKVLIYKDNNDTEGLYRYLLITQCNALSSILPGMFQKIEDYTELLLPENLLRKSSVVERMIAEIPEEDWTDQVQIIGWLYQYYNSEKKDEVFAALKDNVKITKENIPAATQLFTPDWIVRYMVENSLGRLWVEDHPNDDLKSSWKYYLNEAEQEPEVKEQLAEIRKKYATLTPEDIKCIDPCCGSGHILVYMFDVLMQIYNSYGYSTQAAVSSIITNNLYGMDIDERATQLAYFAVMMKARSYDSQFFGRDIQPHVYAIRESNDLDRSLINYYEGNDSKLKANFESLIADLHDAKEYGSILKISNIDFDALLTRMNELSNEISFYNSAVVEKILPLIHVGQMLKQSYHVVVTNPPYMGSSNMDSKLSNFVKKVYPDSKSDLFACFIERGNQMVKEYGYNCMVTMQSWMFLSSFEKLRVNILATMNITNLMHMDNMVLGIAFGTAVTVFQNCHLWGYKGTYNYIMLKDIQGGIPKEFPVKGNRFAQISTDNFSKIPGSPMAYWASENILRDFEIGIPLERIVYPRQGMATTNNNLFLRQWFEVNIIKIGFSLFSEEDTISNILKWFPYNKGGEFRKWYGNNDYIVNFQNKGEDVCNYIDSHSAVDHKGRVINRDKYFKPCITWSKISSGNIAFRYKPRGFIFDVAGTSIFGEDKLLMDIMSFLNSKVALLILTYLSPTLNYEVGHICSMPIIESFFNNENIYKISTECKNFSKLDWDAFETSWDFDTHPFVRWSKEIGDGTSIAATMNYYYGHLPKVHSPLELCWLLWQGECNDRFEKLKNNEEELNRIFIEIYELQDELSPEEECKDVTVRKADLKRDIRSFLSYAIGCMFGRYSLDLDGLAYAGGEWDASKYETYQPDYDGILPICDDEYFTDDIVGRFVDFIRTVYGSDTLEENLQFIADALGGKGSSREVIRKYFLNDFFADHCKIYQKRPIYWLFDSGKKNGFKCLIYLHRYRPDTIARIRTDYVHEQQARYRTAIADLENRIETASTSDRIKLNKELKKVQEQADELHDYEEKIHHLADQYIDIDLDDGVKVNYAKFQDVLAKIK